MHERSILFSTAGAVYLAGYARSYHRPEKWVRDARAKDARDRVSGMHKCSILLSTARGRVSERYARSYGHRSGTLSRGGVAARDHRRGCPRRPRYVRYVI